MKLNVGLLFAFVLFAAVVMVLGGSVAAPLFLGQPVLPLTTATPFVETSKPTVTLADSETNTVIPTVTSRPTETFTLTATDTPVPTATLVPSATRTASPTLTPSLTMPAADTFTLVHRVSSLYTTSGFGEPQTTEDGYTMYNYVENKDCTLVYHGLNQADGKIYFSVNSVELWAFPGTLLFVAVVPESVSVADTDVLNKSAFFMYDPEDNLLLGFEPQGSRVPVPAIFILIKNRAFLYQKSAAYLKGLSGFCTYLNGMDDRNRRWGVTGYKIHDPLEQGCPEYGSIP
jgi:hypothetical protein